VPTTYPYIVNHFKETAVHVSTYGGVRGRQRLLTLPPTLMLLIFRNQVFLSVQATFRS